MTEDGAAAWDDWYAADCEGRTIAQALGESKRDGMRRAFLAGRNGALAGQPSGGEKPARLTLAWLMWCYEEGYGNPVDRAGMENWMAGDPARMHPDDVKSRRHLLGMADEVLAALAAETRPAGG